MNHAEILAIARIARQGAAGRLSVTTGGDGLRELTPPFSAFIYEPTAAGRSQKELHTPSEVGLDPAGKLFPVQVVHVGFSAASKAGININPIPDIASGIEGCWLCVDRKALKKADDLYFYELKEYKVIDAETNTQLAQVTEFMETAAHGVLVVTTPENTEVMIPMVDQYLTIDRENKLIKLTNFEDLKP